MEFFKPITIEEGIKRVDDKLEKYSLQCEEVNIGEALGRVISKDIVSHETVPSFDKSTVDGYAINSKDSHGARSTIPSLLTLIESVEMGKSPTKSISRGEATYVPTGGMIPEGADSVVMIENAEKLDEESVMVYKPASTLENVISKGDDIRFGEIILPKGRRITAHDIGVIASQGLSSVEVFKKIAVSVISTGDEIIDTGDKIGEGKVRDINGYVLASKVGELGGIVVRREIVRDDYEAIRGLVEKCLEDSDIVILSGGSSVGEKDYTHKVIDSFDGEGVFIHGVAVKPGKPTIVGEAAGKLIFGLPGHPASSIILFDIFVKHAINKLQVSAGIERVSYCEMDSNFPSSPGKKTYQSVIVYEEEGKLMAKPVFGKSGTITVLSKADGYIVIGEEEEGVSRGEVRRVIYF